MFSANDTLLLDGPVVRGPLAPVTRDRTPDLARIVRHALKAAAAGGPLDRAIRSAARTAGLLPEAGEDVDGRALMLARRMNALLVHRSAAPVAQTGYTADPHRETLHD